MQKHHLKNFTEFKGKSKKNSGPSDLLVPIHLENYLHKQIKKHKNLKNYFHYLILKFLKKIYPLNSQILLSEKRFINLKINN
ncbi:hypothetical protein LEP1GSC170_0722 [Leptospira interrogans serovar Bataviae str. HAI135]|nr:hypothetical protein LEP1GSC170_0722 [Leptospira interrogans serovar Bataviae str. HAI135]